MNTFFEKRQMYVNKPYDGVRISGKYDFCS